MFGTGQTMDGPKAQTRELPVDVALQAHSEAPMPTADEYRMKAAELRARSELEHEAGVRAELDQLALAYLRLAAQAEKNAATDIVYETPAADTRQPAQQQQQPQARSMSKKEG
jgi:hypothetical protein